MKFAEYYDKVHGGWLGRVVGSQLGAPLEFLPFKYTQWKYCDKGTKEIDYYIKKPNPQAVNDDEIYEILGLLALEEKGVNITSKDIAQHWDEKLYKAQYTAEKAALKNIRKGIFPPDSASNDNGNFWYDAIGGQMKADIWGLIAPGCPKIAAKYAEIDGSVAHQGVGIDGELYLAAIVANTFETSDLPTLIQQSLEVLPLESEYRIFVEKCIQIAEKYPNWRNGRKKMVEEWNIIRTQLRSEAKSWRRRRLFLKYFHGVHVLPNAGIIVLSLLYGANDKKDPFGRPICIAGMMAMDTDCNCGNIGTIMGTLYGADKIPKKWTKPLRDEFHTYVKGHEDWKISELSDRIAKIGVKVMKAKCPEKSITE
ncbi:MAG: ADP-ribosylglycohydrolase family protein [Promethearchaeota archaeon]|nr:MAG: ADP-ribosylglycohydrolase family protein [Candidatus Lokiarchaeota archaeon]